MTQQLTGWDLGAYTADGMTFPTYRRGTGPGVIVVHEIPGITPKVQKFAEDVVDAGFTVVMPSLVGTPGDPRTTGNTLSSLAKVCISKEFVAMRTGQSSAVTRWLSALAEDLHGELGGPGVGALGMCFSGGFALAMMVDGHVAAPVLSQPAMPFPVTPALSRDLGLSPAQLSTVKERVAAGCHVLGLRYLGDPSIGKKFDTLKAELGDGFIAVELPGKGHSVLTEERDKPSVQRVLDFFREKLAGA